MLHEDINGAPRLAEAHYVKAFGAEPERVLVEFAIDRQPDPDRYLVGRAAILLQGGTDNVAGIIESLATDRLRSVTGTSGRIHDDGYAVTIQANLPVGSRDSTVPSGHSTAQETPTALTPAQAAAVSDLEHAISAVLPDHHRGHAPNLATMVAKELPGRDQVIEAYQHPSLQDVIQGYQERYDPEPAAPAGPGILKHYQLSFPQHPATALNTAPGGAAAPPANTKDTSHADAGYSR